MHKKNGIGRFLSVTGLRLLLLVSFLFLGALICSLTKNPLANARWMTLLCLLLGGICGGAAARRAHGSVGPSYLGTALCAALLLPLLSLPFGGISGGGAMNAGIFLLCSLIGGLWRRKKKRAALMQSVTR